MRKVWWVADSVVSPLGSTSVENFSNVASGKTGARNDNSFGEKEVCLSMIDALPALSNSTRFEELASSALRVLTNEIVVPKDRTLFILSTTKGNIELLEKGHPNLDRIHLHQTSAFLAKQVGLEKSMVVSNACTSGVVALIVAKRQLESGNYDHALILGADVVTKFVVSGFQSLNALSDSPCRPFDAARTGINLGEAAAAILVTAKPEQFSNKCIIQISGGAITNDANHISGPSKTGVELALSLKQTLRQADVRAEEIDFVSAHGTATLYNDEMESKAFYLSGLSEAPLHSLKGNFGHTLGAAGVIESVMCAHSLSNQELLPSLGYDKCGVSKPLNVIRNAQKRAIRTALKTSSGFGGCNASILFQLQP